MEVGGPNLRWMHSVSGIVPQFSILVIFIQEMGEMKQAYGCLVISNILGVVWPWV